jgi:hypothetical protein
MNRTAALPLALLLAAPVAHAGPWATGKGHFYAKASFQHLRSERLAQPDGTVFAIPRFTKQDAAFHAVIGLDDRLELIVNLPAVRSSHLQDFGRESGFGDVQGGFQLQLGRRGSSVFALRAMLQAPTGDATKAEGLLPTGSGVWEGEIVLGAGRSLLGGRLYGFVEVGHQLRELLRDGVVYAAQVGWNATDRLVIAANVRGVEPYDKSARGVALGNYAGVGDRVTYATYGPTVILKLGRGFGVQLDVDGTFRARNLARGVVFRAGATLAR